MTRVQAKQVLITFGIEEPTEEQITNYLNSISDEVKTYKDKAKTADELQKQLDEVNEKGLTDLEKAKKDIEISNQTIADLKKQVNMSEVKAIFGGAGLKEEDYKDLIGAIVTDDLETSKTSATNLVNLLSAQKTVAEAKIKEDLLNGTPGRKGGNGGGGDERTEAEKLAETLSRQNVQDTNSQSVIDQYK